MKKVSVNQFNKGLNLDNNPVSVSNDSLIGALNATFITKNGNEVVLQNDMGNASVDKAQLPAGYVPLGVKEHGGIIYIASYNPLTDKSQIGCFPSPQRNFATDSDKSLGFKNLCEYDGNTTYEQKIVEISDDNIIRPGDKFIITATKSQIADFENYPQYIRLKVLIITSDNQSIDITNELVEPSGHFENVKFVKNIENDIQDTDYTIYTNRSCGQLCLRAELIIPNKIELSYFAEYKKILDLFPNDYQEIINNWNISSITPDTFVTNLHVKVTPYDEYGNIFDQNTISGYESDVNITDGYIYNYSQSNQGDFYYLIYGESDNSIINFNYTPQYIYTSSQCLKTIYPLKKSEQVEFSLIGSGKVTFNTFRYFNDFDNNHLVLNYGLKFYSGPSYELTNLYLELINLRDLNSHNWDYTNQDLKIKRVLLNIENTSGIYTEVIDYFKYNVIFPFTIFNDAPGNKINVGQYYLARICAKVNGTTLYKGDWHALLTSEATNYLYNGSEQDMLKLYSDIENTKEILLDYNLVKNNVDSVNDQEELTGEDNYFVVEQPTENDLRYEVKKYGQVKYTHEALAKIVIPKYFPFSESEMSYNPQVQCHVSYVDYQDDIITDGTYNPSNKVKHYDNIIIKNRQNIGGDDNTTIAERNEKNKLFYEYEDVARDGHIDLKFNYELYSQLISPFDSHSYNYNGVGPAFISYASRLSNDLLKLPIEENNNRIYPERMLYCIYHNNRTIIGECKYVEDNADIANFVNNSNNVTKYKDWSGIYHCSDFEISDFLNQELGYPNIVIFSSCVDGDSDVFRHGRLYDRQHGSIRTKYDMMLIKGTDDNLYLIQDITDKGKLLQNFKDIFENIYIYKPEQDISLNYWIGNRNNYFATNDYKIYLDYDVSYTKFIPNININIYTNTPKNLDGRIIYLPYIKFDQNLVTTEHFRKIIPANSISERVSNFLNEQIIIGNIAKIQNNNYKLCALSGNKRVPLNEYDCYILKNNNLINCKDYNYPDDNLYNISQKIKNNLLLLNEYHELVLNNEIPSVSSSSSNWDYGTPSNVKLTTIFPNSFKYFKLFE